MSSDRAWESVTDMTLRSRPGEAPGAGLDRRVLTIAALLCLAAVLSMSPGRARAAEAAVSAAPAGGSDALAVEDPFERTNRRAYALHQKIDRAILKPLAKSYQHGAPKLIQAALHNLITELSEPVVFGNDVLQLRFKRAGMTAARFLGNATFGFAGLLDPATQWGLPHHDNGFGTTLGRYGIQPGPYLFIPVLGPTNFRDLLGTAMDFYSDPLSRNHYHDRAYVAAGIWIIGGIDERAGAEADLEQIESMGTDTYATLRSLYMQSRQSEIRGGAPVNIQDLPNFDETPAAPSADKPSATPPAPAASSAAAPAATDAAASAPSSATVQALFDAPARAANALVPPPSEWLATSPPAQP